MDKMKDRVIHSNLSEFKRWLTPDYVRVVSRKSTLLMRSCFAMGISNNQRYSEVFGFPSPHRPVYDSFGGIFTDKSMIEKEVELAKKMFDKRKDYFKHIIDRCQVEGSNLWKKAQELKHKEFDNMEDEELMMLSEELLKQLSDFCVYLQFPISLQGFFENSIKKELKNKVKDKRKAEEYFHYLTTPKKQNRTYFEQVSILNIGLKYREGKSIEQDIKNHLEKFGDLGVKYGIGKPWTEEDVMKRVAHLADKSEEKLNRLLRIPHENELKVNSILDELKAGDEFVELVDTARAFVFLRTYRTDIISGVFTGLFGLFKEIGKRNGLSLKEVLESLPDEVVSFKFRSNIMEDSKLNVLIGVDGRIYVLFGDEAEKVIEMLNSEERKGLGEINGVPANRGVAVGVVKVVFDNSQLWKVNRGDVLVSPMTTPDFLPAIERASAIITDEGGILSHAAIISRELDKPCVIGTRYATKVLKDGMRVRVDGNKGVVEVLG